jgi:hypothetical protein
MVRETLMKTPTKCRALLIGSLLVALAGAAPSAAAASSPADPPAIRHRPPVSATPGAPLTLEVHSRHPEAMIHLRVHYRALGERAFDTVEFARLPSGAFVAEIPAAALRSPGIEYYLAASTGTLRGNRFASSDAPHLVRVDRPSTDEQMEAALAAHDGRRSRFSAGGTYVDFGPVRGSDRTTVSTSSERHYAFDVDFTYRFLTTLHALRFGIVRLRGDSISAHAPLSSPVRVGYDYGFAEISLAAGSAFGFVTELQLGANHERFTLGGTAGLRFGRDPGTHYVVWGGGTALVGGRAGVRLHWDTVPNLPMAASVEVTSWPDARRGGLRLAYQAEVTVSDGLTLVPELSYQARSARFGRLGGALRVAYAF